MKISDLIENILEYWLWAIIIVGLVYFSVMIVKAFYKFIKKKLKQKTKEELEIENEQMQSEIQSLTEKINALESQLAQNNDAQKKPTANNQLINVGTLKIKSDNILFIVSQSFEQKTGGNSRIKVIHYINTERTDSVYSSFDAILEQLSGDYMMINKNQLVNLREVHKIQGYDLYIKNVKSPFLISETKKEELELRLANL